MRKYHYILIITVCFFQSINSLGQNNINKDSLFILLKSYKEDTVTVKILNQLSHYYLYQKIDSSVIYTQKALKLSEKLFYEKGIADSYHNIGRTKIISGNYKEALNYFYRALRINEKQHDLLNEGKNYANIGVVHYYQGDLDKAINFYKKAVKIYTIQNYFFGLAKVYNNLGLIYSDLNKLDTAQNFFNRTIEIAEQAGYKKIEISAIGNATRILLIRNEFNKVIEKLFELVNKTDTINDKSTLSIIYANIAIAYLSLAKKETNKNHKDKLLSNSLHYNFSALKIADELNSNSLQSYAVEGLKNVYKEKKDYKNAFKYFEKLTVLKDSLFNQEKAHAIANIEAKYQNEKKQIQIKSLQKEQEADRKLIKKKNIIISVIIIGFIAVLILSLFLFNLYKGKKYALNLLGEKNKAILKQREEISTQRDKISEIAFELKKINRTKNKLFSIIAHDLKNPFQGIIGFSEMIKTEADEKNLEQIGKFSEYIYDVSNQTYKLLDNLLDFTRSQIGLIKYNPVNIKIKNIVEEGLIMAQANAEKKGINLIDEIDPNLSAYCDESMMATVLRNLISNAVKFTEPGGIVKITGKKEDNQLVIKVIDSGIGIKEKDIPKLFKADLNFSTFGTQNEKGTGLGLVICKDFVTKNNGTITVKSEIDKGSTFTITLPVKT